MRGGEVRLLATGAALLALLGAPQSGLAQQLQTAGVVTADAPESDPRVSGMLLAARRWWTFFSTGDERLMALAVAPTFRDNTPPLGRATDRDGAIRAVKAFRQAAPDLVCSIDRTMLVKDMLTARGRCRGTFTGSFMGVQGSGQRFEFAAADTYRIVGGQIVEDWHSEDYLALFTQIGLVRMPEAPSGGPARTSNPETKTMNDQASGANAAQDDRVALDLQRQHFDTLLRGDVRAFGALFNDDAVWEWPFAIPGNKRQVRGRAEIDAYLAPLPQRIRFTSFNNMRLHRLADGEGYVVTYDLTGEFLPSQAPYVNRFVGIFTVRNGRFQHYAEYYDSYALHEAASALGSDAPFKGGN